MEYKTIRYKYVDLLTTYKQKNLPVARCLTLLPSETPTVSVKYENVIINKLLEKYLDEVKKEIERLKNIYKETK